VHLYQADCRRPGARRAQIRRYEAWAQVFWRSGWRRKTGSGKAVPREENSGQAWPDCFPGSDFLKLALPPGLRLCRFGTSFAWKVFSVNPIPFLSSPLKGEDLPSGI